MAGSPYQKPPEDVHRFRNSLPEYEHPGTLQSNFESVVSNVEEVLPHHGTLLPVAGHPGYFYSPSGKNCTTTKSAAPLSKVKTPPPVGVRPPSPPDELVMVDDATISSTDSDDIETFDDGLEMQGFIYEEPLEAYWNDKPRLDSLGAFNGERWSKMKCIHFVLPNMKAAEQAATPRQANVPHYQTSLANITSKIELFRPDGGIVKVLVYQPNRNYSNKFLHVTNLGVPQIQSVDWTALAKVAYESAKNDTKRQHRFKDYGTTGGQCTTRVGSSVGVSKPAKKSGTTDVCIVDAMVALSEYTKSTVFKWLPKGMHAFNSNVPDDPRNQFAKRFHKDCCIPASRVGLTNLENPCSYHVDEMNSSMLQYESASPRFQ
jgi:hypothetical protein